MAGRLWQQELEATSDARATVTRQREMGEGPLLCSLTPYIQPGMGAGAMPLPTCRVSLPTSINLISAISHEYIWRFVSMVILEPINDNED